MVSSKRRNRITRRHKIRKLRVTRNISKTKKMIYVCSSGGRKVKYKRIK